MFKTFCSQVQNENGLSNVKIRSDHGRAFEDKLFEKFFDEYGISHIFSCLGTPQQNGVIDRKNITLQEMDKTMITKTNVTKHLWEEVVNADCYIQNKIFIRPIMGKTPYKLWKNKKPNVVYFLPFVCTCFILNTKNNLNRFDSEAQSVLC